MYHHDHIGRLEYNSISNNMLRVSLLSPPLFPSPFLLRGLEGGTCTRVSLASKKVESHWR